MADKKDELLDGILGEELGEWDKMFDSLHEGEADVGHAGDFELPTEAPAIHSAEAEPAIPLFEDSLSQDSSAESFDVDSLVLGPSGGPSFADSEVAASRALAAQTPFLDVDGPVFSDRDEEFEGLDFGGGAEALGSLLGSGPIELPDDEPGERSPPSAIRVRAGQESMARLAPLGPEDAALDDFSHGATAITSTEILTRVAESATAFFDEAEQSGSTELTLELDDDFYDGIQIDGGVKTPVSIEAINSTDLSKGRGLAHTVRRDAAASSLDASEVTAVRSNPIAAEALLTEETSVRAFALPAQARRAETDEPLDFDGPAPLDRFEQEAPEAHSSSSDGIPQPSDFEQPVTSGFGVLRTKASRAESEDNHELEIEVDGALDEIQAASPIPATTASSSVIRDRVPPLDGVVEAAVEDAISLSTGTLLTSPNLRETDVEPDLPVGKFAEDAPSLDVNAIQVPVQVEIASDDRTEEFATMLVLYERELALLDEVAPSVRLRIEAGRLAEALGDLDKARVHLDEALKLDPRLVPANRALRRIERLLGNWSEVLNQLDKEMAKASPMERRALASYRADLLIATGELDLARVAVGELLDSAPTDTRSLLANLELAFVDGRDDEIAATLDSLALALRDASLGSVVANLQGLLAERSADFAQATRNYSRSAELRPNLAASLAQVAALTRDAKHSEACQAMGEAGRQHAGGIQPALCWLEAEALLASGKSQAAREVLTAAKELDPGNLLLAQTMVRSAVGSNEQSAHAWRDLAEIAPLPSWSGQCFIRASQLAGADNEVEFLERALVAIPNDASAMRALRQARVIEGNKIAVQTMDLRSASSEPESRLFAYRSAQSCLALGDMDAAGAGIASFIDADNGPVQLLAFELAFAAKDDERLRRIYAKRAESASSSADAQDAARGTSRAQTRLALQSRAPGQLVQAAESWRSQSEQIDAPQSASFLSMALASLSEDGAAIEACASQALTRTTIGYEAAQLAIERAGRLLVANPRQAAERLADLPDETLSHRAAELQWCALLGGHDWAQAAEVLEAQARKLPPTDAAAADRDVYRAAYLRVQRDIEADVATEALEVLRARRPAFAAAIDLLSDSSSGSTYSSAPSAARPALQHDDLSAEIRRAEALARGGSPAAAADLFARLSSERPNDALIAYGYEQVAWQSGASAQLAETALSAMRQAEEAGDMPAKSQACSELARIDGELRGDSDSALMLWESASKAAPDDAMMQRILEREYGDRGASRTRSEAMRLVVGRILNSLEGGRERSAYLCERARLALGLGREATEANADFHQAFEDDQNCREALLFLESFASAQGPSEQLANLEAMTANYFVLDERARAAFLVRSGETWRSLDQREQALARFKSAVQVMPGFAPALFAWRDLALDHELWQELADACLLEAQSVDSDQARTDLYLLAGVTLMDKAEQGERAAEALRRVLIVAPAHRDAFVRLRQLFTQQERYEDLAQIFSMRLEVEKDDLARCELHHALAAVLRDSLDRPLEALEHLRAILLHRPNDKLAVVGVSEIAWQQSMWAEAAESLMVRARLESDPAVLKEVFTRLGTIYSQHMPEPNWALKSFHKVVSIDPSDTFALKEIASLGVQTGDFKLALGACEQLIKQDPPVEEKISHLQRMASILLQGFDNVPQAERALRVALDLDPSSEQAFDGLLRFYVGRNDMRSARVHADRVASAMRAKLDKNPGDASTYRTIARAMQARVQAGTPESKVVSSSAASIAMILGDKQPSTRELATGSGKPAWLGLATDKHDDLLFPPEAPGAVRALFALLGDRLAKHAGIDVRNHGVGRSDRLKKGSDPIATLILEQSAEMGIEDVDIYISTQIKRSSGSEPTSPPSIILGSELASLDRPAELRFLVGRSLKFVGSQLSVPLQLGVERFGVLLVGILRQFQPEFAPPGVNADAASAEQQKLRRLIPSNMLQELAPFALGLATNQFDHKAIFDGLVDAGNRVGLLAAADTGASIRALMRIKQIAEPQKSMQDPEIASLIRFACAEEHARLWAAVQAR